jgi:DNA invertase Pin-like site-specific DNA recombinase
MAQIVEIVRELLKKGVRLRSLEDGFDLPGLSAQAQLAFLDALATAEIDLHFERKLSEYVTRKTRQAQPGRKPKLSEEQLDKAVEALIACQRRLDSRPAWRCKSRPFPARHGCLQKGPRSGAFL